MITKILQTLAAAICQILPLRFSRSRIRATSRQTEFRF